MTASDAAELNFFDPSVLADPYDLLARLRKERPVARVSHTPFGRDVFLVTSHALCEEVFRRADDFSSDFLKYLSGAATAHSDVVAISQTAWPEVDTLFTTDEPDHMRLRTMAARGFMPNRIKRMSDLIAKVIDELIDGFAARGSCDFIRDFAVPMPIKSIAEILGIPSSYHDRMYDWTFAIIRRNGQMGTHEEQIQDARDIVEMKNVIASLVEERRISPQDDLISDLSGVGESPFTEHELLSTIMILLIGGAETTRSTLIATMAHLVGDPEQLAMVRADPALVPRAIDETLRFDTPASALLRFVPEATRLGDETIPAGSLVMIRLDSANRDPAVFADGDRFDIMRPDLKRHLSFGLGIHYCIGFRLAREQAIQSIAALLRRLDNLRIDGAKSDLRIHPNAVTRCLRELHLTFDVA